MASSHRFYNQFWRLFCSLKLAATLLSLLAVACLVGMFWDQTLTLEQHLAPIAKIPAAVWAFTFLELNDVFHSWWFGILVLLLALNLIACSIERLPKIYFEVRYPERELDDDLFARMSQKAAMIGSVEKSKAFLAKHFPAGSSNQYYFKQRHKYARFGVYVIHTALLFIMFGSILATNMGIDGMMSIPEGSRDRYVSVRGPGGLRYYHDLGFDVACTDFRLKTFVDGSPMDFESDLVIFEKSNPAKPVVTKTIRVNEPLQYNGYTFYQASYQPMAGEQTLRIGVARHGEPAKMHVVKLGQSIQTTTGHSLIPVEVIEDYGGLGAAVKMQQIDKDGEPAYFVVFRQYPDFDPMVRRGEWDIYFQGFDQHYRTGVSVGQVPFVWMVFVGFVLMFVGLYMAFAMSHRRYYARLKILENGQAQVAIAGQARRHQHAFKDEFELWMKELNQVGHD